MENLGKVEGNSRTFKKIRRTSGKSRDFGDVGRISEKLGKNSGELRGSLKNCGKVQGTSRNSENLRVYFGKVGGAPGKLNFGNVRGCWGRTLGKSGETWGISGKFGKLKELRKCLDKNSVIFDDLQEDSENCEGVDGTSENFEKFRELSGNLRNYRKVEETSSKLNELRESWMSFG